MHLESTLGTLVLLLKNACFNVAVALTVLVALGNELRRWKLPVRMQWLEERHDEITKAWYISLGIQVALSLLYAYLEHRPETLIVDGLSLSLMAGGVLYLKNRGGGGARKQAAQPEAAADEDDEPEPPRRPLRRVPTERVPRTRRPRRPER